jgi:hypothetical protein
MTGARGERRPRIEVDHLVAAARTLEEGVAWCEATLGVVPEPGGRHATMGTHNRLLDVSSARHPRCFLEIMAIDPSAAPPRRVRWFDLDAPALQRALRAGPRLVHWVARTTEIATSAEWLRSEGQDPGQATVVERMTPRGLLRWRITLREDGRRPADGAMPLLIEWGEEHPCDTLADSGVALERIEIAGVAAELVATVGVDAPNAQAADSAPLAATLATPKGLITLVSPDAFVG